MEVVEGQGWSDRYFTVFSLAALQSADWPQKGLDGGATRRLFQQSHKEIILGLIIVAKTKMKEKYNPQTLDEMIQGPIVIGLFS